MEQVESDNKKLFSIIKNLETEVDLIIKKTINTSFQQSPSPDITKVNYLQEVNEQMFQQNVRLRNLIEKCIEQNIIPTQKEYYEALRENEGGGNYHK